MRQVRARALLALAILNIFVLVAAVVVLDVIESRPPAAMPYPAAVAQDAPAVAPQDADRIDPDRLADKLDDPMSDSGISDGLSAYVADAATGEPLFDRAAEDGAVPASTTKLVTAVAVLHSAGPDTHVHTEVFLDGDQAVLVGGGDPTLTAEIEPGAYPRVATLEELAEDTAAALAGEGLDTVRLGYDDTLYPGSDMGPGWKRGYVDEGSVAPVHALMLDGGRVHPDQPYSERVGDPPGVTADAFAEQLEAAGITVEGDPSPADAPGSGDPIAAVDSAPISALVEKMLLESDNNIAEALARQVAIAQDEEPSFQGASAGVAEAMADLGVADVQVEDGSGLSVDNRITPKALVDLVLAAADPDHPDLYFTLTGLPTANFTGTLTQRYSRGSDASGGAGVVRAKTGTLSGVSTLAGTVYDREGRLLAFAFMANNEAASGPALDTLADAIAQCGCS
ncbi:D-alanyl-D-alanine carboxypeptidase/D-alanyl-D-alanine-endopeptidase [Nocardiopsis sediminis]|uniref:D-alanyl-D-alanine carboxypeptidase/D-alanyl-D-alanine-endopeptidase n=1 Tax=Nocardiopsis sediminis TaxID=1778267 RepID=A0ABV8FIX3_9ACTN